MRLLCRKLGSSSPNLAASLKPVMGSSTCCVALSVCPFGIPTAFVDGRPVGMPTPVCVKCPVAPVSITPVGAKVLKAHLAKDLRLEAFPPWPPFFVLAKFACSILVGLDWGLDESLVCLTLMGLHPGLDESLMCSNCDGLKLGPGNESLM